MNQTLLKEIINHIYCNFLIVPSDFINTENTQSLFSENFILDEKIEISLDDKKFDKNICGCQLEINSNKFKILGSNISVQKNIHEISMLVSIDNLPSYGLYLSYGDENEEPLIACTIDQKEWLNCNTYLQATFLAGMESIKDTGVSWNKCKDYKKEIVLFKSFINFHHNHYEINNEG